MVLVYNSSTFEILKIAADGGDTTLRQQIIDSETLNLQAGEKVGGIADDALVLANPPFFIAVETATVLSGTERRKSIQLTIGSDPIELSETNTISLQLKDKDLVNDPTGGVVVTLSASNGIITPSSITTNGSGQNPSTITYKPAKYTGDVAIRATSSTHQQQIDASFTISEPGSTDDQGWLENGDIKPNSISSDKQLDKAKIRTPGLHNFWFINKAFRTQIFDVNNDGNTDQNINSIVVDDLGFFYVNCFEGPGATNPVVKRINKATGAVDWSVALTHDNLSSRFDGMAFDGTYIWVACANYLRRVNVLNSADTTEYLQATDIEGGNFQALAFDGDFIWAHLRGGTNTHADKIWKITPSTGAVSGTPIDYRTSDPIGTGVRDIKQFAMDDEFLYFTAITPGVTTSDWTRIKRSDGTLVYRNEGDLYGSYGIAIDNLSHHIYTGGGQPGGADQINLDTTDAFPRNIALNWDLSQWYDLIFDGRYVWGIGTINDTTATRRFIRKMVHNVGAGTLDSVQAFDFDNIAASLSPTALAFDGQYLYVANFASTTNSVVKIFVGS